MRIKSNESMAYFLVIIKCVSIKGSEKYSCFLQNNEGKKNDAHIANKTPQSIGNKLNNNEGKA